MLTPAEDRGGSEISHPNITLWADFVRGLVNDEVREAMREHLDTGCRRCTQRVVVLERVRASAEAEAGATPPAGALRSVKALAALHRPERSSILGAGVFALCRNSALEPALGGFRSGDDAGSHLFFEVGDCTLDLSVETGADPSTRAVSGNYIRRAVDPVAGASVVALSDGRIATAGTTGELGEFAFEALPAVACELWLFAQDGRPLVAALDLSA